MSISLMNATNLHVHQHSIEESSIILICAGALFSIDGQLDFMADFLQSLLHYLAVDGIVFCDQNMKVLGCGWVSPFCLIVSDVEQGS